jgi:alkanesulfonate monooxygenase SsuD/methylene tetrahydromethanopterin reductase-like flavin-dependent oxidoreductase (luciferase family)
MFSTLQALTGSQAILGIGAGWMESEYRMYGYPYPPPRDRIAELADAIKVIRALWTEAPATYHGERFSVDAAWSEPRPAAPPLIMIGASGEQLSLRVVARQADWWNTTANSPTALRAKIAVLAEHCGKVGRDPEDILVNWQCQCVAIGDTADDAQRIAEASPMYARGRESAIVGTPETVATLLREYVDVGVRDFILRFADFPRLDNAQRFAREVAPKLHPRKVLP